MTRIYVCEYVCRETGVSDISDRKFTSKKELEEHIKRQNGNAHNMYYARAKSDCANVGGSGNRKGKGEV